MSATGNGQNKTFSLVRSYVLLALGVGLVIFALLDAKPAVLTLGGGIIGLNPVIRATM